LDRHAAQADEVIERNCSGLRKEVWNCSERVMGDIEAREAKKLGQGDAAGRLV